MFGTLFSSVYSTDNVHFDSKLCDIPTFDLPNNVCFSIEDVFKGLSLLKGNWSVGPDGILGESLYLIQSIIA